MAMGETNAAATANVVVVAAQQIGEEELKKYAMVVMAMEENAEEFQQLKNKLESIVKELDTLNNISAISSNSSMSLLTPTTNSSHSSSDDDRLNHPK